MGIMFGWENGFFKGFMLWVRYGIVKGMVPGIFEVSCPVHAGSGSRLIAWTGFLRYMSR